MNSPHLSDSDRGLGPRLSPAAPTRLRQLTLVPTGGLCNRLRAIASARRLCRRVGARCVVVWTWGDFAALFARTPDVETVSAIPGGANVRLHHQPSHLEPHHCVDLGHEHVELHSGYVFWGADEARIWLSDLRHELASPAAEISDRIATFAAQHNLTQAVGIHMRRTDNRIFAGYPPDELFFAAAREALAEGSSIFLAADNVGSEAQMRAIAGDRLITHPKRAQLTERWPRPFDVVAAQDDVADLFLLARTNYIVGTHWSSFSGVAMALNGSKRNRFLKKL